MCRHNRMEKQQKQNRTFLKILCLRLICMQMESQLFESAINNNNNDIHHDRFIFNHKLQQQQQQQCIFIERILII